MNLARLPEVLTMSENAVNVAPGSFITLSDPQISSLENKQTLKDHPPTATHVLSLDYVNTSNDHPAKQYSRARL